jgi:hypothetical protein
MSVLHRQNTHVPVLSKREKSKLPGKLAVVPTEVDLRMEMNLTGFAEIFSQQCGIGVSPVSYSFLELGGHPSHPSHPTGQVRRGKKVATFK